MYINRKEGIVLFNDALNTFYLRLYKGCCCVVVAIVVVVFVVVVIDITTL